MITCSQGDCTFLYLPIIARVKATFANAMLAELIRYPSSRQSDDVIRDFHDGAIWKQQFVPHFGNSPRNMCFSVCVDGVRVAEQPNYEIWPITVSVLNFPPWLRAKRAAQWMCGIIPGPKCANPDAFLGDQIASQRSQYCAPLLTLL